jgi:hypothetical protein
MTPETRLAVYAVALSLLGVTLIVAAVVTAGRDHRRQP